jgi:hypothetical protein
MAWTEVMRELEEKLVNTLEGKYRPRDGVPFFRVQYPPAQEREAVRQFRLLQERLTHQGRRVDFIRLTEILWDALAELVGCSRNDLRDQLVHLEARMDRSELQQRLATYLPKTCADALVDRLGDADRRSVALLVRPGVLYPFVRPSTLLSLLEGRVMCAVVLAYPTHTIGAFLDASPAGGQGGYYRGEIIRWRGG